MPRLLNLVRVVLVWAIVLSGVVVIVAAVGARVVRQYGEHGDWGNTTATDGLRPWQAWALLCVLGTGVLVIAALWGNRPRWWLLPIAVAGFVLVAVNANGWHDRLLAEHSGPRTYLVEIPVRPPVGPTQDERGFPLHFESVERVYEMRIPAGIAVVMVSSFVAGLISLLMLLVIADDLLRRRRPEPEPIVVAVS